MTSCENREYFSVFFFPFSAGEGGGGGGGGRGGGHW